jgi:hypothetical protein
MGSLLRQAAGLRVVGAKADRSPRPEDARFAGHVTSPAMFEAASAGTAPRLATGREVIGAGA